MSLESDRAAITEAMFRYARATDWNQPQQHRTVFAADCIFASPRSDDLHGVDAVVEWMETVLARFDATQHLIGNISIDFTGPDDATAVSYVRAWHRYIADRPDLVLWGEYHDRWVRADDGWRIAERRVLTAGIDGATDPGRRNPRHQPHAADAMLR